MEAVSRAGANLDEVVDIVASDPAMSTKVLQLVNSAFFGSASRVVSIRDAVGFLGLDLLKGLAVNVHIFGMAGGETVEGFSLDEIQRNAIVTARLARRLVTDPTHRDEAFTAALVRDVGRVIMAVAFPERSAAVSREVRSSGRPLYVVEREEFSVTHAEVGAYLIGVWGLPSSIVETVAHHHRPGTMSDGCLDILAAVHAADVLVDEAEAGAPPSQPASIWPSSSERGSSRSWSAGERSRPRRHAMPAEPDRPTGKGAHACCAWTTTPGCSRGCASTLADGTRSRPLRAERRRSRQSHETRASRSSCPTCAWRGWTARRSSPARGRRRRTRRAFF